MLETKRVYFYDSQCMFSSVQFRYARIIVVLSAKHCSVVKPWCLPSLSNRHRTNESVLQETEPKHTTCNTAETQDDIFWTYSPRKKSLHGHTRATYWWWSTSAWKAKAQMDRWHKDWTGRSVAECVRLAHDWEQWRNLVHHMVSGRNSTTTTTSDRRRISETKAFERFQHDHKSNHLNQLPQKQHSSFIKIGRCFRKNHWMLVVSRSMQSVYC